jgi:hypothetical protein
MCHHLALCWTIDEQANTVVQMECIMHRVTLQRWNKGTDKAALAAWNSFTVA